MTIPDKRSLAQFDVDRKYVPLSDVKPGQWFAPATRHDNKVDLVFPFADNFGDIQFSQLLKHRWSKSVAIGYDTYKDRPNCESDEYPKQKFVFILEPKFSAPYGYQSMKIFGVTVELEDDGVVVSGIKPAY